MNKFIAGKTINLRDIEIKDAEFTLNLRLNSKKNKFLNQTSKDLEKQIEYIKRYKNLNNEWYFIIENKASLEPLGTVRIYDVIGNSFCWGSWIIKENAPLITALESAILIYEYAFYNLGFDHVHFDVRKENLRVKAFHERFGATKTRETGLDILYEYTKQDYEKIREKYKNKVLK